MSKEMKIALIGAAAIVLAAIISGIFLLRSTAPGPTPTVNQATPTPTTDQVQGATPPPTQTAQPTYSDIRGTYSLYYQRSGTGPIFGATLQITQQNHQNFQGSLTNSISSPINNGTVDQNRNIWFTVIESDSGNQITVTYTGAAQFDGSWRGTWSGSNGTQGTWYTTGRLFMP